MIGARKALQEFAAKFSGQIEQTCGDITSVKEVILRHYLYL
jgi:hypothetical protein